MAQFIKVKRNLPRNKRVCRNPPVVFDHVKIRMAHPTIRHFECHIFLPRCPVYQMVATKRYINKNKVLKKKIQGSW